MPAPRKTGVSHLRTEPSKPSRVVETEPEDVQPPFDRVFEVGTHQFSDETGEYAVDPETGKVLRKL